MPFTRPTRPPERSRSKPLVTKPAARIVVTVADNGQGMDESTLQHAFDPFFSARSAGRRRGMGLPKALRWIEASGGTVRLESRPGQGTRGGGAAPDRPAEHGPGHQQRRREYAAGRGPNGR